MYQDGLTQEINVVIAEALGIEPSRIDRVVDNPEEFDSIGLLDAISALEEHFDIEFTRAETARISTKEDVYNLVYQKLSAKQEPLDLSVFKDAAIIIPVYNHAATIGMVIEQSLQLGVPVFVVDDGSTDRSGAIAARYKEITLLRHGTNQGKGAALRTGFQAAQSVARWAITIDADGQYLPSEAARLMKAVSERSRPIVVANRMSMAGPDVPWTSRMGRGFSNFWVWMAGGGRLPDTQSGLRVYPLPEVLELGAFSDRFQYEVEVLAMAGWHKIPVISVPVRVNYQRKRISHFRPWMDFWRNSVVFTRLITMRLLVPPVLRRRWTTVRHVPGTRAR